MVDDDAGLARDYQGDFLPNSRRVYFQDGEKEALCNRRTRLRVATIRRVYVTVLRQLIFGAFRKRFRVALAKTWPWFSRRSVACFNRLSVVGDSHMETSNEKNKWDGFPHTFYVNNNFVNLFVPAYYGFRQYVKDDYSPWVNADLLLRRRTI